VKKVYLFLVGIIIFGVSFSGCAQKTQVRAIQAAQISDPDIKDIAVVPFANDNVSQAVQINDALSNTIIKGQKYFNVVDRVNLEKIMDEKKLNDSGLVDIFTQESSSGLKQVKTLLTGEVSVDDVTALKYLEERSDYNTCIVTTTDKNGKSYCTKYKTYFVNCQKNSYTLTSNVQFIKVDDGKIIFSKGFTKNTTLKHCTDDTDVLPSKKDINTQQAAQIANDLVQLVAPSYVEYSVTLLDDEDIKYTKEQSKQLEIALELIKNQRIEKANEILHLLNNELNNQSYTTLYNLAVTEESLGNLQKAYQLYQNGETLTLKKGKVIEEIAIALSRVKKSIDELEKANKQLNTQ